MVGKMDIFFKTKKRLEHLNPELYSVRLPLGGAVDQDYPNASKGKGEGKRLR